MFELHRHVRTVSSFPIRIENVVWGAGDSIFTQSAPGKRQKTAAERKAERARKQAELEDVDPDQPWALEVLYQCYARHHQAMPDAMSGS